MPAQTVRAYKDLSKSGERDGPPRATFFPAAGRGEALNLGCFAGGGEILR